MGQGRVGGWQPWALRGGGELSRPTSIPSCLGAHPHLGSPWALCGWEGLGTPEDPPCPTRQEYIPDLYAHFLEISLEAHMYASQWFLTLFTAKFPLYMVFHIIDLLLCEVRGWRGVRVGLCSS